MVLFAVVSLLLLSSDAAGGRSAANAPRSAKAERLAFGEFFEASPRELKPTAKLLGLHGKRVKLVGYMAQLEEPLDGAFYLAAQPLLCGEGGAGTGDLPPEVVRVVVRSRHGKPVRFIPGPLEVTGILEVGNQAEEDGSVSAVRLVLDRLKDRQSQRQTKHKS